MNLIHFSNEQDYKEYYINNLVKKEIYTQDNIRVRFEARDFHHAFFESVNSKDDTFSIERAKYMSLIEITITAPKEVYWGWDKKEKNYINSKTVSMRYFNFIVVIRYYRNRKNVIQAKFITCYWKENTLKIKTAPKWKLEHLTI